MDLDALDNLFSPKVKHRPWMGTKKFVLGTVDNLAMIMDECISSCRYGIDIETSGLDNRVFTLPSGERRTVDRIAGVCLSPDGVTGYYIPLHHAEVSPDGSRTELACNIPIAVFDREFMRLIQATEEGKTAAVFHNSMFDQEFFQFNETGHPWGEWDKLSSWDDTLILTYLGDSRKRDKRLKTLSEEILDIEQVHLDELFPPGHKGRMDFTTLDPTDQGVLWYACGDAICTRLLYDAQAPAVYDPDTDGRTQKTVYMIEKGCAIATRWMQRNRIHVNLEKVAELITLGHKEWLEAILDVYVEAEKVLHRDVMPPVYRVLKDRFVADNPLDTLHEQMERAESLARAQYPEPVGTIKGRDGRDWPYQYDVNSAQQLGTMFDEMEIPGLKKTEKSGQIKTSKDELERIVEEAGDQFPFMRKIKRFREVNKALATYLYPMAQDTDPLDHLMRINFNPHKVDTGRFATPASENKERMIGWPQVNFQAIPSVAFDPKKPRPECMRRIRECINTRPMKDGRKRFIVAIDYSGVELRLVTNISREPKWLSEFFHCSSCDRTFDRGDGTETPAPPPPRCPNCGSDKIGDLHTLTGIAIYGPDAPQQSNWKVLRGYSKSVNFALCYGGGGSAVVRALKGDIDKNEGWRIKNRFDQTYLGLSGWWKTQHQFAEKHAFVRTAMGRKYPLPDIKSEERMFVEKAKRNAVNGPIQGSSADITKTAMTLIHKECKKRGWLDKCQMIATMHDELVFEIDGDILEEACKVLVNIMTSNTFVMAQKWPVPLTTDTELGYDWSVPWDINGMRAKESRFIGNKKIKKPEDVPEGYSWDALDCWPTDLQPFFVEAGGSGILHTEKAKVENASVPELTPAPVSAEPAAQPSAVGAISPTQAQERKMVAEAIAAGVYEYQIQTALSHELIVDLAKVIKLCDGRGLCTLVLRARDGTVLEGWTDKPVKVSPMEFRAYAEANGLMQRR